MTLPDPYQKQGNPVLTQTCTNMIQTQKSNWLWFVTQTQMTQHSPIQLDISMTNDIAYSKYIEIRQTCIGSEPNLNTSIPELNSTQTQSESQETRPEPDLNDPLPALSLGRLFAHSDPSFQFHSFYMHCSYTISNFQSIQAMETAVDSHEYGVLV